MRNGAWVGLVAAAVAAVASSAVAQGPTTAQARRALAFELPPALRDDEPRWVGDWSLALEEAQRRNSPVVAVLCDEGTAFKTVQSAVYSKPEFAAWSRKCVLLAAFQGRAHGSKPRMVDGHEVAWCDLFGCPCDDHVRSYVRVQNEFATREFWNPLHVFLTPQGVEAGRVEGHLTTQDKLDEELTRVRKTMSLILDYPEYRDLMARLRAIVDAREKKGSASAHAELGKLLVAEARAEKDPAGKRQLKSAAMKAFVESLQAALVQEGEGLLEDADELAYRHDVDAARKLLFQVQKSFKGLPPSEAATKALAKLPPPADPKRRN